MKKRSAILIAVGAIVLVGAVAWTSRDTAVPTAAEPKQAVTPAEQSGGTTPAEDTSEMTTQQAPTLRPDSFTPPPSAGTGVYKPPK